MALSLTGANGLAFPTVHKTAPANTMETKARHAFHAARQRCSNPKNPSFPGYGEKGIKFLFGTFEEFVEDVGLPVDKSFSLDRINPQGHYEPGNVRWSCKKTQALNKVGSAKGAVPLLSELVSKYQKQVAQTGIRLTTLQMWDRMVRGLNRGGFSSDDAKWFAAASCPPELFEAGWEMGQEVYVTEEPSYFHLPSLTWPGRVIVVRGGPFSYPPGGSDPNGTIRGMTYHGLHFIEPELVDWVRQDAKAGDVHGSTWVGQTSWSLLQSGGIEGRMLLVASVIRRNGASASFMPLMGALAALKPLGNPALWDEIRAPVLDAKHLFLPDLQIDAGAAFEPTPGDWSRIASLLRYRIDWGHKTYVGVQNPHKLPDYVAALVLGKLRVRELPNSLLMGGLPSERPTASGQIKIKRPGFAYIKEALGLPGA